MSERLVLFSEPSPVVFEKLRTALFPEYLTEKVFAYMPSDGADTGANAKFNPVWQQFAEDNGAEFIFIDNSKRGQEAEQERRKIVESNILVITGGNTYKLLNHLRQSGLGEAVKEFWQKGGVVLSGFSAGAIVLTPSIEIAKTGTADANELGLTDLTGLDIVDFEVWPHYEPAQEAAVADFRSKRQAELKTIGNEDVLVIDK